MARSLYTVFGGSGFLGRRIVQGLVDDGHRVRIAVRRPERAADLVRSDLVEAVQADLFRPETLSAALVDADGAVNAISLYLESGRRTFDAVHVAGAARLARLAREADVGRLVHLSGIGADPASRDPYIRARGAGEEAVRRAYPEGASIVRSGAMFGEDDALLAAIETTLRRLPAYPLFGRGERRIQPVHVVDVARGIVALLTGGHGHSCYEFAGPRAYSYRRLVRAIASASGRSARLVPVPFPVWQGAALVAERLPGAPLTRSQVALMRDDNVPTGRLPGLPDLGISPRDIVEFVREERRKQKAAPPARSERTTS